MDRENIIELKEMLTSMRNSQARNVTQALVTFLFKLRTGNSNSLISVILGLENEQKVSQYCDSVIKSFEKDVLPNKFGFTAASREDLLNNQTSFFAKKLLNIDGQLENRIQDRRRSHSANFLLFARPTVI